MNDYISKPQTLDELIRSLHILFDGDKVDVDEVKAVMYAYKSNPDEWMRFAKFDNYRYTRNLVNEGNGKFNLMILCWGEGHGSSIHDHMDSHCFVKILQGHMKETLYNWPTKSNHKQQMSKKAELLYDSGQVTYINDSMGLHQVENLSHSESAVTLHLYSPPFDQCCCFDQRSGHRYPVKLTFYSKFGERTPFTTEEIAENN
uniref:Cysteine dioxygenase n=1 Tax=Eptatretus burgeri TaxID=7764 RepID=A0A8C4N886_EPTBU